MAENPTHKFGQKIGELLEIGLEPILKDFAEKHSLYLDKKGTRSARRGKRVSWIDGFGNKHDLDFVLERGGSDTIVGTPVAFIETAWRRYTKHSKNKAQEIQGAILPLASFYHESAPFIGVVLAGDFTEGSLVQLKSLGFHVLHYQYSDLIDSFAKIGIDASFHENTPDNEIYPKISGYEQLSIRDKEIIVKNLFDKQPDKFNKFITNLDLSVNRIIELIRIIPLSGQKFEWNTIEDAISFIQKFDETQPTNNFVRYEIDIRYNNGDKIQSQFVEKETAIKFLNQYKSPIFSIAK